MPPRSKISKFPAEIRSYLESLLIERAFGDIEEVTAILNDVLERAGIKKKVGKSAVGLESQRLQRSQETIGAVTRQMQAVADSSPDDHAKRSQALNAMISTQMFEALLESQLAATEPDPAKRIALLNKAALGTARLSTSNVEQLRFRQEVEKRAKEAADKVEAIAKKGGLSDSAIRTIRAKIMGVSASPRAEPRA